MLNNILDSTPLYIAIKDRELRYIECNELMAEGLDLTSPAAIREKNDYAFFDDRTAQLFQAGDLCVLLGDSYNNQREFQPFKHRQFEIITNKFITTDRKNLNPKIHLSFHDITGIQHEKLRAFTFSESEQRYYFKIDSQREFFTRTEFAVFNHLLEGKTYKKTAKCFNNSPRTIEEHVKKIRKKLQCNNRNQVVRTALTYNLIITNYD